MSSLSRSNSASFEGNVFPVTVDDGSPEDENPKKLEKRVTIATEGADSADSSSDEGHGHGHGPPNGPGWGRGIVWDAKQTVGTYWVKEMTNFNQKTIAVGFFLFFAAVAPAITFGGIYAKATGNWIGAVEMLTATAWIGITYALIGGQPIMINGGTGPVLAFSEILFQMANNMDVPFLTFNAWVGLWVTLYMVVAAFTGIHRVIDYATRFTDEIFALLISLIFIINAFTGVFTYFDEAHPAHDEYEDDVDYSYMATAFLSLFACLGVVYIAFKLREVKFSPFFHNQMVRNVVTDFAVVAGIVTMTLIANLAFKDVETETLNVPKTFAPTYACCTDACDSNWPDDCPLQEEPARQRPWLVNLGNLNGKNGIPFIAAGPAFLAFILVFLDDGITWHLINHPSHKITHGEAANYDTLLIGLMIGVNSMLGMPWLVAATVRSLNHVHALAEKTSDGKIISIQETRLTGLLIHLLVLASIFALDILKLIPMPVLYGVFLFMGLAALGSNQFWGRFLMFFMQPSKYPQEPYTEHVKPKRMHLFTLIQICMFGLLYVVISIKVIAIAFPLVIALCIPIRVYVLPRIFTEKELVMLDSDDEVIEEFLASEDEPGRKRGAKFASSYLKQDDSESQPQEVEEAEEEP